jgi:predicted Zn-dependent protease
MNPVLGLVLLLPLAAAAQVLSSEKEAALGRQIAAEIRRQSTPLDLPEVQVWIDRIGRQLASGFRPGIPWAFELTADETSAEPTSAPGGFVFIPAGAILSAASAEGFVSRLAHQMGHVANPNSMRPARTEGTNVASIPLVFMGGWLGHGHGVLVPKALTTHAQQLEEEADALASEAIAKAGELPTADFNKIQQLVRGRPKPARRPPTLHRK